MILEEELVIKAVNESKDQSNESAGIANLAYRNKRFDKFKPSYKSDKARTNKHFSQERNTESVNLNQVKREERKYCRLCRKDNHNDDECYRRKKKCFLCQKQGHSQNACPMAQVYVSDGKKSKVYLKKTKPTSKPDIPDMKQNILKTNKSKRKESSSLEKKGSIKRKLKLFKRKPKRALAAGLESKDADSENENSEKSRSESEYESYEEIEVTDPDTNSDSETPELRA